MRRINLIILIVIGLFGLCYCASAPVFAAVNYEQLAPLPSVGLPGGQTTIPINPNTLELYFKNLYRLGIVIATGLAVLMVMWGGIEYITTDAIGGKEAGKERIQNALLGLLLALSSYVILRTIDPRLLSVSFGNDPEATVNQGAVKRLLVENTYVYPGDPNYPYSPGTSGDGNIIGPDGNSINPTELNGKNVSARLTYYSRAEALINGGNPKLNAYDLPLVTNDNYSPNIVGSAASSYYPGGTIIARNINGNIVYNVIDDNNIGSNGRPVNNMLTGNNAFDIPTEPGVNWNNLPTYNQNVTVVSIPHTRLSGSTINSLHNINNLKTYLNSH